MKPLRLFPSPLLLATPFILAVALGGGTLPAAAADRSKEMLTVAHVLALEVMETLPPPPTDHPPPPAAEEPKSLWGFIKDQWDTHVETAEPKPPPIRTIAFWPVWEENGRVPEAVVRQINDAVLAEMLRQKHPNDRFIERADVWRLAAELDRGVDLMESGRRISALMAQLGADLLIMADVVPVSADKVSLAYKVVHVVSGEIVAQSRRHDLLLSPIAREVLSVSAAARVAAQELLSEAPGLSSIALRGLRYQRTGVETPFAAWFLGRVGEELRTAQSGAPVSLNIAELEQGIRGLSIQERPIAQQIADAVPGRYVLEGTYWDLGDQLDIQLSLTDGAGHRASWRGQILVADVPKTLAYQPAEPEPEQEVIQAIRAVALRLSSLRGPNPIYRPGDRLVLLVEVDAPSYLYCFYRDASGRVMRIFPNRFRDHARIDANQVIQLPGPMDRFDWVVEEPLGVERVACHATDRPVSAGDVPEIGIEDFEDLNLSSLNDVARALGNHSGLEQVHGSMVVNVVPNPETTQ